MRLYDPYSAKDPTKLISALVFVLALLFGFVAGNLGAVLYKTSRQSEVERLCYQGLRVLRDGQNQCAAERAARSEPVGLPTSVPLAEGRA